MVLTWTLVGLVAVLAVAVVRLWRARDPFANVRCAKCGGRLHEVDREDLAALALDGPLRARMLEQFVCWGCIQARGDKP